MSNTTLDHESPMTGRILDGSGQTRNLVDLLGGGTPISDQVHDIDSYAPLGGKVLGEDGKAYSLVELLENHGKGSSAAEISVERVEGGVQITAGNSSAMIYDGPDTAELDSTLSLRGKAAEAFAVGVLMEYDKINIREGVDGLRLCEGETLLTIRPVDSTKKTVEVIVQGKNLIDYDHITPGHYGSSGWFEAGNTSWLITPLIPLCTALGGLYQQVETTLSSTGIQYDFLDADQNFISKTALWYGGTGNKNAAIEIPDNAAWLRVEFGGIADQNAELLRTHRLMLSYAQSASDWEDFSGMTTVILNVEAQNHAGIVLGEGQNLRFDTLCTVETRSRQQAQSVEEIVRSQNADEVFRECAREGSVQTGTARTAARRFVTNTVSGTALEITDALACRAIRCSCASDVVVSGTNLLPACGVIFSRRSQKCAFGQRLPAGTYTLSLEISTDRLNPERIQANLSDGETEGKYVSIFFNVSGRQAVQVKTNDPFDAIRFTSDYNENIIVKDIMFTPGYNGSPIDYWPYLAPRVYSPVEVMLKAQPVTLTPEHAGDRIEIEYIVRTDFVGTLMYGLSGSAGATAQYASPEMYVGRGRWRYR